MTEIPLKSVNIDGGMIAYSVSVDIIEESRPLEARKGKAAKKGQSDIGKARWGKKRKAEKGSQAKERQGILGKKGKEKKARKRRQGKDRGAK